MIKATTPERIADAVRKDYVAAFTAVFGEAKFTTPTAAAWACPWKEGAYLAVHPSGRAYESNGTTTQPVGDITDAYCRSIGRPRNDHNEHAIQRAVAEMVGA